MAKKTVVDLGRSAFSGKRVLVRVDFNVPQHEDGTVSDDSRIVKALPTIQFLKDAGAKIILASHLGRPKGPSEKLSLKPIAQHLGKLLNQDISCLTDCVGNEVNQFVSAMKEGQICLLENLRFHKEEETNDKEFAKQLGGIADIYVNDAFGCAHRAHASTEGITHVVKPAVSGLLMEKELKALSGALDNPSRPFATIIGGAKVSSKMAVLENLLDKVDVMVIGGAMAFTFLKAQGLSVGKSLVEDDRIDYCKDLIAKAIARRVNLILPVDVVASAEMKPGAKSHIVEVNKIAVSEMGLDLGPATMKEIIDALKPCKTILWNGPLGVFEMAGFEKGTYGLIDELVDLTKNGATTIVGGGDSVAAIEAKGISFDLFTHVSTGGGASLEFLEGRELPGVACLADAQSLTPSAS